jgi:Fe-S-cluster containining protein
LHLNIITSLPEIEQLAIERAVENDRFAEHIRSLDSQETDTLAHSLNQTIEPQIDCTSCGNCCRSLMINVTESEANALSTHLHQNRTDFDAQYLEKGGNGMMIMNTIPCHFLLDDRCTVYEHRFSGCREFPAMHLPGFRQRIFTTLMHYGRCPIIFNLVEAMKTVTRFE